MDGRSIPFDRIADRYDETRGGLGRGRRFAASLSRHLAAGRPVLELGCGTGAISMPLIELGHSVVGLDISRPMLKRAAARLPGRILEGDACRLPIRSGSVRSVVSVWLLHLVGDRDALAREVARVLEPDGRLLVVAADAEEEPDDLSPVIASVGAALGRGRDRSPYLAPWLEGFGFVHELDTSTDTYEFDESPNVRAANLEQRVYSMLWDLDDAVWAETVQPAIDALRALPEPDSPRRRVHRHILSVYHRP